MFLNIRNSFSSRKQKNKNKNKIASKQNVACSWKRRNIEGNNITATIFPTIIYLIFKGLKGWLGLFIKATVSILLGLSLSKVARN